MRAQRRFLIWIIATLVVIGVLRGGLVSIIAHLHALVAMRLIAVNVVVALFWVPVAAAVAWTADSTLSPRQRGVLLAVIGIASVLAEPAAAHLLTWGGASLPRFPRRVLGRSDTNALFYVAIVGAAWAVAARRRQIASEIAAARLQTALANAQLHVLTLQLHPHFLFNALNLISQLAYESVSAAERTIANLRALLVESLRYAAHREVALSDELRFLGAYLQIQQERFRDRLTVTIRAANDVLTAAVPHLVLQPLVENAIVHGLSVRAEPGRLAIAAQRDASRLLLSVADDGAGLSRPMREGIGLSNTRLRLEQLFGRDYHLSIGPSADRGTVVVLDIPYRAAGDASTTHDENATIAMPEAASTPSALARIPVWLQVVAGWAAVAMLWTELGAVLPGSTGSSFVWTSVLTSYAINAGMWVLLTPLVVKLARRFDVASSRAIRHLLAHIAFSVLIAALHTAAWIATLAAIHSPQFKAALLSMFGWGIWDMVAYGAIVALATLVAASTRFRDVRLGMARTQARLASARVTTLRLRLQPAVLLAALDALARVASIDAEQCEATIARMGDLLRMLLSRSDRELVSVDEELELLDAYLDVVNAPHGLPRAPTDLPRLADVADVLLPAMLLPTLAAAMGGELELLRLAVSDGRVHIAARSGARTMDAPVLRECEERLHELFEGRERVTLERDESGRTIVELEFPEMESNDDTDDTLSARYDLATA